MRTHIKILAVALLASAAWAEKIRVAATTETLKSLVEAVGGERVEAFALSRGVENPHSVLATPTLMIQVNRAQLFVETGMELELWVENLLDGARNAQLRRGAPGHVYAYRGVDALEVPTSLTRADGDIHPMGNPHIWLDPLNSKTMAANIAAGLIRVDPAGEADYTRNLTAFQQKIDAAYYGQELVDLLGAEYLDRLQRSGGLIEFLEKESWEGKKLIDRLGGWRAQFLTLRGRSLIGFHKSWAYFAQAFDMKIAEHLEPKPGISPTPGHLRRLQEIIRTEKVACIVCEPYYDSQLAARVAEEAGIRSCVLPSAVGGDAEARDYFKLFDRCAQILLDATK